MADDLLDRYYSGDPSTSTINDMLAASAPRREPPPRPFHDPSLDVPEPFPTAPKMPYSGPVASTYRRPGEYLEPAEQGVSDFLGSSYGLGASGGELVKNLLDSRYGPAAVNAGELLLSAVPVPGLPKGKMFPRKLDPLGFYSHLDQTLGGFSPKDTVTWDTLAQRGVKRSELEARGVWPMLQGGQGAKVGDIAAKAGNPINLLESRYGGKEADPGLRRMDHEINDDGTHTYTYEDADSGQTFYLTHDPDAGNVDVQGPGGRFLNIPAPLNRQEIYHGEDAIKDYLGRANMPENVRGPARWPEHSLDPDNPTYRETVLHLPEPIIPRNELEPRFAELQRQYRDLVESGRGDTPEADRIGRRLDQMRMTNQDIQFRSGHWSEPNVIAHMRTSMQRDAQGQPVYLLDELQSDWGQKLREGEVRDEGKIAGLRKQIEETGTQQIAAYVDAHRFLEKIDPHLDPKDPLPNDIVYGALQRAYTDTEPGKRLADGTSPISEAFRHLNGINRADEKLKLLNAELRTAEAATPGHPFVNTTDQWTTTALRRLLAQANESGAAGIAITPGQMQADRFNLSRTVNALAYEPERGLLYYKPHGSSREGPWLSIGSQVGPKDLRDYVGKEIADRLLSEPLDKQVQGPSPGDGRGAYHVIDDLNRVPIGGHGMRYAYDQMYPKMLQNILRKLDPQHPDRSDTTLKRPADWAGNDNRPGNGMWPQTPFAYFPLTPKVKEEIAKGLPLFRRGGSISAMLQRSYGK